MSYSTDLRRKLNGLKASLPFILIALGVSFPRSDELPKKIDSDVYLSMRSKIFDMVLVEFNRRRTLKKKDRLDTEEEMVAAREYLEMMFHITLIRVFDKEYRQLLDSVNKFAIDEAHRKNDENMLHHHTQVRDYLIRVNAYGDLGQYLVDMSPHLDKTVLVDLINMWADPIYKSHDIENTIRRIGYTGPISLEFMSLLKEYIVCPVKPPQKPLIQKPNLPTKPAGDRAIVDFGNSLDVSDRLRSLACLLPLHSNELKIVRRDFVFNQTYSGSYCCSLCSGEDNARDAGMRVVNEGRRRMCILTAFLKKARLDVEKIPASDGSTLLPHENHF